MADEHVEGLKAVLLEILHNDVALERDDLHARLAAALPTDLDFSVVLSERRRFAVGSGDIETDRLYLPFLSFVYRRGRIITFDGPRAAADHVREARELGWLQWDHKKALVMSCRPLDGQGRKLVSLVEQVLLSYYYACGHYEHFMDNASRRFAKGFLRDGKSLTTAQVMEAIRQHSRCDVLHLIYEDRAASGRLLYDPSGAYARLSGCPRFMADLARAVDKKGTFSGRSRHGQSYVVSVATVDRSYQSLSDVEPSGAGGASPDKRHVLVLSSDAGGIPMDAIKFGPNLFHMHLANEMFSARERLIFDIYGAVSEVERRFVGDPPSSRGEIEHIIGERLTQILAGATDVTAAELLIARVHDPFTGSLPPTVVVRNGQVLGPDDIAGFGLEEPALPFEAFRDGAPTGAFESVADYAKVLGARPRDGVVGFAFPIRVGPLTRGVLECYSSRAAQLRFDEDYLGAIAAAIGDAVRRLEAAADVAWLSRLSFLHSARHELENFLPLLQAHDKALHSSLSTTLARYSGVGSSSRRSGSLGAQAAELLQDAADGPCAAHALVEQIETVESVFHPDGGFQFIFAEVLSTLVSNAQKHAALRAGDFRLDFAPTDRGRRHLAITYRNLQKRIAPERAGSVATAPIPDFQTSTYHYGLFLLAAQVRMNGGAVLVRTDVEAELDTIPFEICFILPLHPLGDSDAD